MLCTLLLPKNTTASELFKSLNEYFAEKLKWSFYVGVCTDGAAVMIGRLSGLTVQTKEVAPECEATYCVIHREMVASRKISTELNSVFDDIVKIFNLIKALFELHEPLQRFLLQKNSDLANKFSDEKCVLKLAYLRDIFNLLNELNLSF